MNGRMPASCLTPLLAQKVNGSGYGRGPVALGAALEADILVVADLLEGSESVNVVVLFSVLARHDATASAGDVDVLEVLLAG